MLIATVRPIRNDTDFDRATGRIKALIALGEERLRGTDAGAELEVLTVLVEEYEGRVRPWREPSPAEAVAFRLDALGLGEDALVPILGSPEAARAFLAGERGLTAPEIEVLHIRFGLPYARLFV